MTTCVIISAVLITAYLALFIWQLGIPPSISDTYYHRTEAKWLFPACIGLSAGLALVPILTVTPDRYQFVAFIVVASILFVASAPAFKEELEGKVHTCAAVTLGVSALLWLVFMAGVPWIAIAGAVVSLCRPRSLLFWIEAGLLYNLYAVLLWQLW